MKKKLFMIFAWFLGGVCFSLQAQGSNEELSNLPLQVFAVDPTLSSGGGTRTPILVPEINQEAHTLYLYGVDYALTLYLLDEDGDTVYSVVVPAGTPTVILPATLTGDFILQLYPGGNYYFEGEITL